MHQVEVPAVIPLPVTGSLGSIPRHNADRTPDRPVYARRDATGWVDVTAAQFLDEVRATARGLVARGIGPGTPVGILAPTRYEWTVLDFALWTIGAFAVPIYETSSAEQIEWIVTDAGLSVVAVGSQQLAERVAGALPEPPATWVMDDDLLGRLRTEGADVPDATVEALLAAVGPQHTATIVYTSGTTGRPKGCVLTHGNLLFVVRTLVASTPQIVTQPGARTVLFLPLAHVLGRGAQVYCAQGAMQVAHCPDPRTLVGDMATVRPTFLVGVPRIFEKIFNASQQRAHASRRGRIFDRAAAVAIDYGRSTQASGASRWLRAQHALFDRLVYSRLRTAMGGELAFAITGGASLGERLGHFYAGIGLTVMEGYGLTETTASGTFNRADCARIGTVGQPMPGTGVRVADDGEIWLRGPHVMPGYHHQPEATGAVIDPDGWYRTGDLGRIDADGFLQITGRCKDMIVTAGGKNVAPQVLEDRIQAHQLISHALVVGEGRPFVACLITLDPDALDAWASQHGRAGAPVADLIADPALRAEVQEAVDDANRAVSRAESIRAWRILPGQFLEDAGHVTPSMKLKRAVITQEFAEEIAAIYTR